MKQTTTILGLLLVLFMISANIAGAITVSASPNPAPASQNVVVSVNTTISTLLCPMRVDFGDGNITNYSCSGVMTSTCNRDFNHTYMTPGTYTIQANSTGPTFCANSPNPASGSVTITCPTLSIVTPVTLTAGNVGQNYNLQLQSAGGSLPHAWSYTMDSNWLPPGLSLSPTGLITGVPTSSGTWLVNITVTDSCSPTQNTFRLFSLTINPCSSLSLTTPPTLPDATVGQMYNKQLQATGGNPPLTWSLFHSFLPGGLSLSPGGLISGVPTAAGASTITIKATDKCIPAQSVERTFSLTTDPAPTCSALAIATGSTLPTGTAGQPYSQQIMSSGGESPMTFSVISGSLPAGLSLTPTGLISGVPTTEFSGNVRIQASDNCTNPVSQKVNKDFSITIDPACSPLNMVSGSTLPSGGVGQAYSSQLLASGGEAPLSFSVISGSLPAGLSLTTSGLLAGMPTMSGNATFSVRVTDNCTLAPQTSDRSFNLNISAFPVTCQPLNLSPAGSGSAVVGQSYSAQFVASGGETPVTVSLISGSLPAGLTLSTNGMLSGVPTSSGNYSIQVEAADSCSTGAQTKQLSFPIEVEEASTSCPSLAITTPSQLTATTVGLPFSGQVQIAGGQGAVTFSLAAGSLPPGISLSPSGLLSGSASSAGNYTFSVRATDSCPGGSQSTIKPIALVVSPASSNEISLAVTPASFRMQRRSSATQVLTYRASVPGIPALQSDRGVFVAGGGIIGEVVAPVTVTTSNSVGIATESLVVPVAVARLAEEGGHARISYQRDFSGGPTPLRTSVDIFLTTGATADFNITRLQLSFDNGRAETTVLRNYPGLQAKADIRFSGSGLLQGYWEVDGRLLSQVNEHLVFGKSVVLKTPTLPFLPTFVEGSHRVRLVITSPIFDGPLPEAIYFVTSEESKVGIAPIRQLQPISMAKLTYEPVAFSWEPLARATTYLIQIFADGVTEPVASAYRIEPGYTLPEKIFLASFKPDNSYLWSVKGFDAEGYLVAQSPVLRFSFLQQSEYVPGQVIIFHASSTEGDRLSNDLAKKFELQELDRFEITSLDLGATVFYSSQAVLDLSTIIGQEKDVVLAQPNFIFRTSLTGNGESMTGLQSIRQSLNLPELHKHYRGAGVKVAVIDTGIDLRHPDLQSRIGSHQNFIKDSPYRPELHGTAVAGIIAAEDNGVGITGIAPAVEILALRACRQVSEHDAAGECTSTSIVKALDHAIQKQADVVNMSYGSHGPDMIVAKLLEEGAARGIRFVAPVGNNAWQLEPAFPASHPAVISVGGIDEKGRPYPNATLAAKANVAAPAENLFTTIPGDGYNFLNGTSLSSAVVSGLLAVTSGKEVGAVARGILPEYSGDLCRWQEELLDLQLCPGRTAGNSLSQ